MPFRIAYADITKLKVDAIVNPTDQYYSGGGMRGRSVDSQIHIICGPKLREATDKLPLLHLGDAKATDSFGLDCKYIIHTSGPRWRDSHFLEVSLLGSCYRNSVQLAYNLGCRSIAFPLISSHGKHFPKEQALTTAVDAILECLKEYPSMDIILTIYGKWAESVPLSFFDNLSEYVNNTYVPSSEPVIYEPEPKPMLKAKQKSKDTDIVFGKVEDRAADQVLYACAEPRVVDPELIRRLIDKPTEPNLKSIPLDESFAQMLNRLIKERDTKTQDILDELSISGAAMSKLRNGINNPSKLTVFALAIFFKLSIEETKEMLMRAGYAFNPSSIQDVIVSGLIRDGIYDRYVIDDLLYSLDLQPLPGAVID